MTDQCAYTSDGQYDMLTLQGEARDLRTDVDNLLLALQQLRTEFDRERRINAPIRGRVNQLDLAS